MMLPWLAHGHISPFLNLAKQLSNKNFHIYLCSTPICLKPIRETLSKDLSSSIQLIDLNLPSTPELPPHFHTTKDLPPDLMAALKTAFDNSRPAFVELLKAYKPNLLIYDFLQPWASSAAQEENIKAVLFLTCGAAASAFMVHCLVCSGAEFRFLGGGSFSPTECEEKTQFLNVYANGISNGLRLLECIKKSTDYVLIKTSEKIEGGYIDLLSRLVEKKIISLGPLCEINPREENLKEDEKQILDWLSMKEASSIVFISFGSEYFLSKDEIEEIAYGLELSKVGFIWVIRFHSGVDHDDHLTKALPKGFMERIGDRGMVVEGWAPQVKILEHPSIGGFVSHCGWSSTLEGVMLGIPIIAMPMHLDQPFNAKVVAELGVGVEVNRGRNGYQRDEIARVIRQVVVLEQGEDVRRKSKELAKKMRPKGDNEFIEAANKLLHLVH